ncbi:hypothetical protein ACFU6I_23165 [Streptomyces sp. NPDC057486]|uniref:hypothetical protein n=1 Tax=Streptomyces sp. NPDC057486 TaxID=3346145 RepID=UPI00369D11A8
MPGPHAAPACHDFGRMRTDRRDGFLLDRGFHRRRRVAGHAATVAAAPQGDMTEYSAPGAALGARLIALRRGQRRRGARVADARLSRRDTETPQPVRRTTLLQNHGPQPDGNEGAAWRR